MTHVAFIVLALLSADPSVAGPPAAGATVTPHVQVTRQGRLLKLDYQLLDANGKPQPIQSPDYSHPPRFTILQGDKELASGSFEYG